MEELLFRLNDDEAIYQEIIKKYYNDRKIIINQDVNDDLLEMVCMMILKWNAEDKNLPVENRKRIILYINCDGGDVLMGSQILQTIKVSKTPIITVGFSRCASMASYILSAGSVRYCFPNTVVLYHDGQAGYVSSGNKGRDIQKFYDTLNDKMTEFMVENTNMSAEFLEEIKDREYYMFPEEAKERGIVDKIIGVDCDIDEIL